MFEPYVRTRTVIKGAFTHKQGEPAMVATPRRRILTHKDPGPSLGVLEKYVGHNLTELYNAYVRLLTTKTHSRIMSLNLTQWRTLQYIRYNPDQTQRALSDVVGIDPSSMTPIIDLFESKKWVRRNRSKLNRSAYSIAMTSSGLEAYENIHQEIRNTEKLIVSTLGERDAAKLNDLLLQLGRGIVGKT